MSGTVADIPDDRLVERAVQAAQIGRQEGPRWTHVMTAFSLGSTYARQLCVRFGLDPDEDVGDPYISATCEPGSVGADLAARLMAPGPREVIRAGTSARMELQPGEERPFVLAIADDDPILKSLGEPPLRVIDEEVLGYIDEILECVATSTEPRRCTLCSIVIPGAAPRLVWSWANDNDENLVLHAHRGCDAIRREIDLSEWCQGDMLDRLVQWAQADRLNHDLGALLAGLAAEERADRGEEIIGHALHSVLEDEQADADSDLADAGGKPITAR